MKIPETFISCDWGTSTLRLRVVQRRSLEILYEISVNSGIRISAGKPDPIQRKTDLLYILNNAMESLPDEYRDSVVVISGMASSNIGIQELAYAEVPFSMSGNSLNYEWVTESGTRILLISGVCSENNIMRGEETQIVGLSDVLKDYDPGMLIMPGTHSKHVFFQDGVIRAFNSYMTGELFDLLSNQSILKNNVQKTDFSSRFLGSFLDGVNQGNEQHLSAGLFSIRANNILYKKDPKELYFELSGLVIGDELSHLETYGTVILGAAGVQKELYSIALKELLDPQRVVVIDEEIMEKSVISGHSKLLELFNEQI